MMPLDLDRGKRDARLDVANAEGSEGATAGGGAPVAATVRAGRGVLWTMTAKAVFIGAGFGMQLALPRILPDAEQFGRYSTVATILAIVTNTLVASMLQTVSKRTSDDEGSADRTQREGLWVGAAIAVLLGGGFAAAAPWVATHWQRDPTLAPLLATAAIVIVSYSLYAALIGSINGRREFSRQASFDMGFALLRNGAILAGAALGAAAGAIAGFATASVVVLVIALVVVGAGRGPAPAAWRAWAAFLLPIAIYQASLNGVLQLDQPLLRANLNAMALDAGMSAREATALASTQAGYYRAAQTFAFVPYQLILAVTFVVFPTVARATSSGDAEATRAAIRGAMRFSLIVLLAMAAPIAGASDGVMRVAYQETYLAGAPALAILSPGLVPFALFAIGAAILAGAGRARTAALIAAGGLVVVVGANVAAVRAVGVGPDVLIAAALATTTASTVALVAVGLAIHRLFGAFVRPLSALRAIAAAACGWMVAHAIPHSSALGALGACVGGALAYVAALALTREIDAADLALVRRVISRR
jgi:stage V sporulation protein B